MNARENLIKAVTFDHPEYIPMNFVINPSCWFTYPHELLFELMETHPLLFPDFKRPEEPFTPSLPLVARKEEPFLDDWHCLWKTSMEGITGTVVEHPLTSWDDFDAYKAKAPSPDVCTGIGPIDWEEERERIKQTKEAGFPVIAGLRHGHTFLQLCDIRGYEDLIFDMMDEEPQLDELIELISDFNLGIIKHYLELEPDLITYAEDLGMQVGPMLSPDNFKQYIIPAYKKIMQPAKEKGALIHMHSDGDVRLLVDDLVALGIDALNVQDLVNGIDWIQEHLKGKTCIDLDIDRQTITAHGTPEEIDRLILEEVQKLGSPEGGLMMVYGLYPGLAPENIKAVMDAMEKYAFYYSNK